MTMIPSSYNTQPATTTTTPPPPTVTTTSDYYSYDNATSLAAGDGGSTNSINMVHSPNGTSYTRDELSALSGRMIVPGIPPKDQREAQRHVELIRRHQAQERRLLEKEVKESKKRRADLEKREAEWAALLPEFKKYEGSAKLRKLWSKGGLPPSVRGQVWKLALGNPNDVSPLMYKMCIAKSRATENGLLSSSPSSSTPSNPNPTGPSSSSTQQQESNLLYDNQLSLSSPTRVKTTTTSSSLSIPINGPSSLPLFDVSTSSKPPEGVALKDSFSLGDGEATAMLETIATHFQSSSSSSAAAAAQLQHQHSLSPFSSPRGPAAAASPPPPSGSSSYVKEESAKAIAVDLHRTIILRSDLRSDPMGRSPKSPPTPSSNEGREVLQEGGDATETPIRSCMNSARPPSSSGDGGGSETSPLTCSNISRRFDSGAVDEDATTAGDYSYGIGPDGSPSSSITTCPSPNSHMPSSVHVSNLCDDAVLLTRISRLLKAFVELRPDIGYVQGMSYLAAMILLHIPNDHDSFIALVSLLDRGHLRYFYAVHHQGMSNYIATFEDVLAVGLPTLYRHFLVVGVNSQLYVIDWWMSLFSRTLPYEIASRCWDLFLLDEAYLYRVSMCLLLYFDTILHDESPMDEILMFFSRIQQYSINEHRFFELVADEAKYPPSIDSIKKMIKKRSGDLPPL